MPIKRLTPIPSNRTVFSLASFTFPRIFFPFKNGFKEMQERMKRKFDVYFILWNYISFDIDKKYLPNYPEKTFSNCFDWITWFTQTVKESVVHLCFDTQL